MKTRVLFAAAAILPGMFLMQTTGTSSVAVIDFDRTVAATPAGKDALGKLNAFATEQQAAIQQKEKEAQDLQSRLRAQDRTLSDTARAAMTKNLVDVQTAVDAMDKDAQQKLAKMEHDLLEPVQQNALAAVRSYVSEHSVQMVFDLGTLQNGIVTYSDTADITTEIIRRITANVQGPQPRKDPADHVLEEMAFRSRQFLNAALTGSRSPATPQSSGFFDLPRITAE